ncbi:MAG: hypothetical protein AAFQ71_04060 [Planctomycetota bacterium]
MRRTTSISALTLVALAGSATGQRTDFTFPFGGATNEQPGIVPIEFYFADDGMGNPEQRRYTGLDPDTMMQGDNRLDSALPADLATFQIPTPAPGGFPPVLAYVASGDLAQEFADLMVYQRRDGFFASGLILPRQDAVWAFRFDAAVSDGMGGFVPTEATVRIANRIGNGFNESGSEFVLIGDTGQDIIMGSRALTDGRETDLRSFFGGQFVGDSTRDGLLSVDEGGSIGNFPDRNAVNGAIVTYYLSVDTQFSPSFLPQLVDLDILVSLPINEPNFPVNEILMPGDFVNGVARLINTTADDPMSPGTLANPQGRRGPFIAAYRDDDLNIVDFVGGNEYAYQFDIPTPSLVSVFNNDGFADPAVNSEDHDYILTDTTALNQTTNTGGAASPIIEASLDRFDNRTNRQNTLGVFQAGTYFLVVDGDRGDGGFDINLGLSPQAPAPTPGGVTGGFALGDITALPRSFQLSGDTINSEDSFTGYFSNKNVQDFGFGNASNGDDIYSFNVPTTFGGGRSLDGVILSWDNNEDFNTTDNPSNDLAGHSTFLLNSLSNENGVELRSDNSRERIANDMLDGRDFETEPVGADPSFSANVQTQAFQFIDPVTRGFVSPVIRSRADDYFIVVDEFNRQPAPLTAGAQFAPYDAQFSAALISDFRTLGEIGNPEDLALFSTAATGGTSDMDTVLSLWDTDDQLASNFPDDGDGSLRYFNDDIDFGAGNFQSEIQVEIGEILGFGDKFALVQELAAGNLPDQLDRLDRQEWLIVSNAAASPVGDRNVLLDISNTRESVSQQSLNVEIGAAALVHFELNRFDDIDPTTLESFGIIASNESNYDNASTATVQNDPGRIEAHSFQSLFDTALGTYDEFGNLVDGSSESNASEVTNCGTGGLLTSRILPDGLYFIAVVGDGDDNVGNDPRPRPFFQDEFTINPGDGTGSFSLLIGQDPVVLVDPSSVPVQNPGLVGQSRQNVALPASGIAWYSFSISDAGVTPAVAGNLAAGNIGSSDQVFDISSYDPLDERFDGEITIYNSDGDAIFNNDDGRSLAGTFEEGRLSSGDYLYIIDGTSTTHNDDFIAYGGENRFFDCSVRRLSSPGSTDLDGGAGQFSVFFRAGTVAQGVADEVRNLPPVATVVGQVDRDEQIFGSFSISFGTAPTIIEDLEVLAQENDVITIDTFGSDFDTEVALWRVEGPASAITGGEFIASDDDENNTGTFVSELIGPGLTEDVNTLPAGNYIVGVFGFNNAFADDFIATPVGVIDPEAGNYTLNISDGNARATTTRSGSIGVNGSAFYLFQVGFVGCNEFDLAEPAGVISQADVSEFINLFFANSPTVAAYAAPFDVVSQADVNAFVAGFFAGCPTN